MAKSIQNMPLPKLDEFFQSEEERNASDLVVNIRLSDITDFPQHPFKVNASDPEMQEMLESIKSQGVITPAIVRKKADGKYEMISGHRRKKASELLKLETIPCIVHELTDEEAIIKMVDSNLQREKVLPSEKAFAYKLKMEAMSHQGKEDTSRQVVGKLETADIIGKSNKESGRQVQRFIRLTYLIPKLLEMVDNESLKLTDELCMALSPAVEISYLSKDEQEDLLNFIECNDRTPSLSQAIKLKKMSQDGTLTVDDMDEIMDEKKPNETPKLRVSMNRLNPILPKTLKNDREREEYVITAVEWYDKYQKRLKERNAQER